MHRNRFTGMRLNTRRRRRKSNQISDLELVNNIHGQPDTECEPPPPPPPQVVI